MAESMLRRRSLLAGAAALSPLAARAAAKPVYPLLVAEGARMAFVTPLLKLVADGGGFEWQISQVPWPRLLLMLTNGEAMAWGVSRNPERDVFLDFSEAVIRRYLWMIAPAGRPQAAPSLDAMKGHTYCRRRGFTLDSPLDEALKDKAFQVVEADLDYDAVLRMMLAGRCEGAFFTHRSTDPAVVERRLEALAPPASRFVVQRPPVNSGTIHFAAASKRPDLVEALQHVNAGLRARAAAIKELLASEA